MVTQNACSWRSLLSSSEYSDPDLKASNHKCPTSRKGKMYPRSHESHRLSLKEKGSSKTVEDRNSLRPGPSRTTNQYVPLVVGHAPYNCNGMTISHIFVTLLYYDGVKSREHGLPVHSMINTFDTASRCCGKSSMRSNRLRAHEVLLVLQTSLHSDSSSEQISCISQYTRKLSRADIPLRPSHVSNTD